MRGAVYWAVGFAAAALAACGPGAGIGDGEVAESRSALRGGDPVRGRDLVLNNGTEAVPYLSCGLPTGVAWIAAQVGIDLIGTGPTLPERKRGMADLPYFMSLAKRPGNVEVYTTNCLLCHASKLGDSLIIGLGNPNADFTEDQSFFGMAPLALDFVSLWLTPAENVELARYRRVANVEHEVQRSDTIGANPADVMFGLLAAHRDGATLQWLPQKKPEAVLTGAQFVDVPAWWNTGKKPNMFHSGFGRGDHARIMMTASMMCLENSTEAAAIDSYFGDIEAFINQLPKPVYQDVAKRSIDATRAVRGRTVYENTCMGCHGDSENNVPPVASVLATVVGTDPEYAKATSESGGGAFKYYFDFFNSSWFGQHEKALGRAGELVRPTTPSYSPPRLAGVWATAPYFHNGSVPTLEAVLDPSKRPNVFRRSFKPEEYDFGEKVGWPYTSVWWKGDDVTVYDATRPGYRNTGHTFAAALTSGQRRDLLEYLKTL